MDTSVLFWISGALVGIGGVWLLWWGLLADRSRGRRRCPKCWYDMSKTEGLRCPECGREANREQSLLRTRRRWKWALTSLIVLLGAAFLAVQPKVRKDGWASVTPTPALILMLQLPDKSWALDGLDRRVKVDVSQVSAGFTGMQVNNRRALTLSQWRRLGDACAAIVTSDEPVSIRLQALSFLSDAERSLVAAGHETAGLRAAMATLVNDPDRQVRAKSAIYCAHTDTPLESLRLIAPLLDDPDPTVRQWATSGMRVLCSETDAAVPALMRALADPSRQVRLGAIGALGGYGKRGFPAQAVVSRLREMARNDVDGQVRQYAPCAVVRFAAHREDALRFIFESSRSSDDALRVGSFEAMWYLDMQSSRRHEREDLVEMALRGLADPLPDARRAAMEYLEQQVSAQQLAIHTSTLEALSASEDPLVARAATRCLFAIEQLSEGTNVTSE
jgi:hypothetical protein